jgi:hypothetical protein
MVRSKLNNSIAIERRNAVAQVTGGERRLYRCEVEHRTTWRGIGRDTRDARVADPQWIYHVAPNRKAAQQWIRRTLRRIDAGAIGDREAVCWGWDFIAE